MPFEIEKGSLEGILILKPQVFVDSRGFFLEAYKKSDFQRAGITTEFVQDNYSQSKKGTIRGIHYQLPPFGQDKLIQVIKGRIWDVVVDLRRNSESFLKTASIELNEDNRHLLYLSVGFGHAFLALSEEVHLLYKCSAEYSKEHEAGIRWDDPEIGISWPRVSEVDYVISQKDRELPFLKNAALF